MLKTPAIAPSCGAAGEQALEVLAARARQQVLDLVRALRAGRPRGGGAPGSRGPARAAPRGRPARAGAAPRDSSRPGSSSRCPSYHAELRRELLALPARRSAPRARARATRVAKVSSCAGVVASPGPAAEARARPPSPARRGESARAARRRRRGPCVPAGWRTRRPGCRTVGTPAARARRQRSRSS